MLLKWIAHNNGTLSSTPNTVTTIVFSTARTSALIIKNDNALATLQVSFDSGTTFFPLTAGESLAVDVYSQPNLKLKSSTASATYKMLIGYGVL